MPEEEKSNGNAGSSNSSGGFFDRFFNSMFHNDNSNIGQQIHEKLNEREEQMKNMRFQRRSGAGSVGGGFPFALHQELEQLLHDQEEQEHAFKHRARTANRSRNNLMYSSSYRMRQDMTQVQIDVDVPEGMDAKDLEVQVVQEFPCVIQWRGGGQGNNQSWQREHFHHHSPYRRTGFDERVRLGQSVDCEKLSANLSDGILRIKAPMFARVNEDGKTSRSIPVTEHDRP